MRACALCGRADRKLTKEHLFGQWIEEFIWTGKSHNKGLVWLDPDSGVYRETTNQIPEAIHDIEVKFLCDPCNTVWGSAVEAEAKRVFPFLAHGTKGVLTVAGAEALATWAMKIAIVREYSNPAHSRHIPVSMARTLHASHRPPPEVRIYALTSAAEPGEQWWCRSRLGYWAQVPTKLTDVLPPSLFMGIFTFARLAVFVLGRTIGAVEREMDIEIPESFIRLWPDPELRAWPLPAPLTNDDLDFTYDNMHKLF